MPGKEKDEEKEDNVLLDARGQPADQKATFEIERKVIGRRVTGVRFCSDEEYETGKRGSTVTLQFEDGGKFMMAVPDGPVELFISAKPEETGTGTGMVM